MAAMDLMAVRRSIGVVNKWFADLSGLSLLDVIVFPSNTRITGVLKIYYSDPDP